MLVGCLYTLSARTANVRPGPTLRGMLSGWGGLPAYTPGLDT